MNIREIVNQQRSGASDRQIANDMWIYRRTVKGYQEGEHKRWLAFGVPRAWDLLPH